MLEDQIWTNQSVVRLMADFTSTDPVKIVTDQTRKIVLDAIDKGWSGPPYDPVDLADRLGIAVQANDSIVDARTVPLGEESFRIEFNPNTSPVRVRYSIAHEIAHTIFPDCAEEVRHRSSRSGKVADAWQLETLCNVGAAELIMPLGQLGEIDESTLRADEILRLQERLHVSTEAILIRLVHLTDSPAIAFAAAHIDSGELAGKYRLDYVIPSRSWQGPIFAAGHLLPTRNVLSDCTAIGFTSTGEESWRSGTRKLRIECLGIPPYPWSRLPRVAGVALQSLLPSGTDPLFRIVKGDATQPRSDGPCLIVHVINNRARSWGGRGFAQAVRVTWPHVHEEFRALAKNRRNLNLGKVHYHRVKDSVWIADMVAQVGYGPKSDGPRVKYAVLRDCLTQVAAKAAELCASIHMPRIGAGNAGGSWGVIEALIKTTLCENGFSVTVYDLPQRRSDNDSPQLSLGGF